MFVFFNILNCRTTRRDSRGVEPREGIRAGAGSFTKDGDDYEITGDLSIKEVTKPVKFPVEFSGLMKDPWGNTKAGLNIYGKINRKDWGLNWNSALETGGVLVGEEVKLNIELQLIKL